MLIQGVQIAEHPASRARMGEHAKPFVSTVTEIVRAARVTAATGLVRSAQTIRSILRNARQYVGGEGLAPLAGATKGALGIVVSAGPSLRRNLHLLRDAAVRDRCVIVATQTVLKPLLAEGIRPHFVAALDWHGISKRFYEGLRAEDVADTTLVIDPQANPVIPASYPGPIRAISAPHLDALLGTHARDMGRLPPGATVAHLCYQIARFLGCDPVALIGQDLGFTDGVYYARGTAIDDVWAPELNPFNTIENLEWTRIVRHRTHLVRRRDIDGKSIYTDAQMETYLQRFEAFFLQDERRGLRTVDATEGGVRKAGTEVATLAETLARHAQRPVPALPKPPRALDEGRLRQAARRVAQVADDVRVIRAAAHATAGAIAQITGAAPRTEREERLWHTIDTERAKVGARLPVLQLLDEFSQLGVFKRAKADRRIEYSRGIAPEERQRLQFERDLVNVRWIEETADEYLALLDETAAALEGRAAPASDDEAMVAARADGALGRALGELSVAAEVRPSFVVPCDPWHGGLGTPRSLAETLAAKPVIQWTLERLGRSREARSIVLLVPEGYDIEALIDRSRIGLPIEIHRTQGSPFGPARAAIAAARLWSDSSWRGGIAGATVYDEVLAPRATLEAMERFGVTAAIVVGPDWPLVAVEGDEGCDGLVRRHRTRPELLRIVFNQSPPGLCGILLERSLMAELARGGRHATVGWLLAYEPSRPQQDPISKDVCVQIDHVVRRSFVRAVFDTPRNMIRMRRAIEPDVSERGGVCGIDARSAVAILERQLFDTVPYYTPQHVVIELNTGRQGSGAASPHRMGSIQRAVMTERRFARLVEQLSESRDSVLTFGGAGDPAMHPDLARFIRMAKDAGVRGVHVRTELCCGDRAIDEMMAAGVDVVSVELDADSGETYRRMHGVDRFTGVLAGIERAFSARTVLAGQGGGAHAVPWIVPCLQRRLESYEDIDGFFDRWQHLLGTAVLEGPPPFDHTPETPADTLSSARAPARAMYRELLRRMVVFSDGTVPVSELDLRGERLFGSIDRVPLLQLWRDLVARRKQIRREQGEGCADLRTRWP
ncbi:MAG: 6-hydroxymethylpterin diphosphokinase MptE-like protein [Planctomycetota bacterium]